MTLHGTSLLHGFALLAVACLGLGVVAGRPELAALGVAFGAPVIAALARSSDPRVHVDLDADDLTLVEGEDLDIRA